MPAQESEYSFLVMLSSKASSKAANSISSTRTVLPTVLPEQMVTLSAKETESKLES
jgi:hypothetical protein